MAARVVKTSKGSNKSAELRGALKEGGIDSLSLYDLPGDSQGSLVFYFPLIVLSSQWGAVPPPAWGSAPLLSQLTWKSLRLRVPLGTKPHSCGMQGWESRVWVRLGPTWSPQPRRGDGSAGSTRPCTKPWPPGFSFLKILFLLRKTERSQQG